jgi:hypothetical protein
VTALGELAPLHQTLLIAAIGLGISSLEDLRAFRVYEDDGLLAWDISRLRARSLTSGSLGRALSPLFAGSRYRIVLGTTLVAAAAAPLTVLEDRLLPVVAVLLLSGVVLGGLRSLYGLDGSDQMNVVVLTAVVVAAIVPAGSVAWHAAAWFVAVQLTLAYGIAGLAKLASPQWRRGTALVGVLSTETYGDRRLHAVLRRYPFAGGALGWAVIVLETCFVLVFVLPEGPRLYLLAAMFLFHLGCAVVMGLNNFFFAFVAGYPALWVCADMSHRRLFGA